MYIKFFDVSTKELNELFDVLHGVGVSTQDVMDELHSRAIVEHNRAVRLAKTTRNLFTAGWAQKQLASDPALRWAARNEYQIHHCANEA